MGISLRSFDYKYPELTAHKGQRNYREDVKAAHGSKEELLSWPLRNSQSG